MVNVDYRKSQFLAPKHSLIDPFSAFLARKMVKKTRLTSDQADGLKGSGLSPYVRFRKNQRRQEGMGFGPSTYSQGNAARSKDSFRITLEA